MKLKARKEVTAEEAKKVGKKLGKMGAVPIFI